MRSIVHLVATTDQSEELRAANLDCLFFLLLLRVHSLVLVGHDDRMVRLSRVLKRVVQ